MPADEAVSGVLDHDDGLTTAAATAAVEPSRYHALDRVRALAMLLGVVYHTLIFRMFTGTMEPGAMFQFSASKLLGDWLHSFRMPLFFLIAGFFGRMMLVKYGTREFFRRRWERIGLTLLISMFTFGPIYVWTRDLTMVPPSFGPGPGPGGMGPPPGRPSPVGQEADAPPPLFPRLDEAAGLPGAPPSGASTAMPGRGGPGPGFRPGPGGGPPGGFPPGGPPGGFRPGGGPPGGPFGGGGVADRIFGPATRFVQLNHLWFLWYLLVFLTVTPLLTMGLGFFLPSPPTKGGDRLSTRLIRWGLAPLLLALASTPALLMTRPMFGWFLGLAPPIFRAFPDFIYQFDFDELFYYAYFMAGWWLHREREALPAVAKSWLPNLAIGLGAAGLAFSLERQYGGGMPMMMPGATPSPSNEGIKVLAYGVYCFGSACTCFAFLGFFLRYLDYPSRTWRYLADTALWVYLIHQPLVLVGLSLARPYQLPWWALTALVSLFTVGCSLILYEAIVRRTPLVRLFGPATSRRAAALEKSDGT